MRSLLWFLFFGCLGLGIKVRGETADPIRVFDVQSYVLEGKALPATNVLTDIIARHSGTNLTLEDLAKAAAEIQTAYLSQGFPLMSVAIAQQRITNGVVPLYVFEAAVPQILISGKRYYGSNDFPENTTLPAVAEKNTNSAPAKKSPAFVVSSYVISGNTLLSSETIKTVIFKYTGTNIVVDDILKAGTDLQKEYHIRGYPTVNVTIPPQQITNGVVKLRVFEGLLSDIKVTGNRHFTSNNVMRAMPSLRTNLLLNGPVFEAELNRANANQDRQIYPKIEPGSVENTTRLRLEVKDRFPLHAKVELNNQSSPGTPDLRVNASAAYNNLWQLEHSFGAQYSFSPEMYKTGNEWNPYDRPLVANYSTYYRLPLGNAEKIADIVASDDVNFGYSEATRKFRLPPPTGRAELNVYASRSTIDTGLNTLSSQNLYQTGTNSLDQQVIQQDLTVNNSVGSRISLPVASKTELQSVFSGGFDYKFYNLTSHKTNIFIFTDIVTDNLTSPPTTNTVISKVYNPQPAPGGVTVSHLEYVPLALRYDGSLRDSLGATSFGIGVSGNVWHSGSTAQLQAMTGSAKSSGYWAVITPSLTRDFNIHTNWVLTLRADGQWASEPLISNEQFGAGGVGSVRGYHEGEVFGDTGWHVSLEQKTPPHIIGNINSQTPLTIRASVFTDYAQAYLLDPQGRSGSISLWGAGFGAVASVGSHWEARLIFSLPLLRAGLIEPYQPFFNFAITAQF